MGSLSCLKPFTGSLSLWRECLSSQEKSSRYWWSVGYLSMTSAFPQLHIHPLLLIFWFTCGFLTGRIPPSWMPRKTYPSSPSSLCTPSLFTSSSLPPTWLAHIGPLRCQPCITFSWKLAKTHPPDQSFLRSPGHPLHASTTARPLCVVTVAFLSISSIRQVAPWKQEFVLLQM